MNHLEQYIRDNKKLFDEEPAPGHFERLQQKMNRKSRRTVAMRWSISVAASVAIIFSIGIIRQNIGSREVLTTGCENTDNMKLCYIDKMNAVAGLIEELTQDFDQWDRQQVMIDVQNIIDTVESDFESELPEELSDHETKSILSDYYRQNLESLEMIVTELTINN